MSRSKQTVVSSKARGCDETKREVANQQWSEVSLFWPRQHCLTFHSPETVFCLCKHRMGESAAELSLNIGHVWREVVLRVEGRRHEYDLTGLRVSKQVG